MPTALTRPAPVAAAYASARGAATVAVVWTSPGAVREDYARVLRLAGAPDALAPDRDTALKTQRAHRTFFPGLCSPPWQVDGVLHALRDAGVPAERLYACHDRHATNAAGGSTYADTLRAVTAGTHQVRDVNLWEEEWVRIRPRAKMAVLYDVSLGGVDVPARFLDQNIIHLPTLRSDPRTGIGGAMASLGGSLLRRRPHWSRPVTHSALVDLLAVQQEVHAGALAVMDGTFAVDERRPGGPEPHVKNVLLASRDFVALDAVAGKLMGIDPLDVPAIREAAARGLGVGRIEEIALVGDDIAGVNFRFESAQRTARARAGFAPGPAAQVAARAGAAGAPALDLARRAYRDMMWHPLIGKQRVSDAMETAWGRLYEEYV